MSTEPKIGIHLNRAEIEADELATAKDVERLTIIRDNLRLFIEDNGGENRTAWKRELRLFEGTLEQGRMLLARIREIKGKTNNRQN